VGYFGVQSGTKVNVVGEILVKKKGGGIGRGGKEGSGKNFWQGGGVKERGR